jgi:hypothetical protein
MVHIAPAFLEQIQSAPYLIFLRDGQSGLHFYVRMPQGPKINVLAHLYCTKGIMGFLSIKVTLMSSGTSTMMP